MQWSAGPGAGFTPPGVEPWLPLGDAGACNVDDQRSDPGSVLALCRDLITQRRERSDLHDPAMRFLDAPEGVLAWRRGSGTTVALNLSDEGATVDGAGIVGIATRRDREGERVDGRLTLEPWEGVVVYE